MGVYVQYGCGLSCPSGWLNFDASPTLRLQRLAGAGSIFRKAGVRVPQDVRYGDVVKGLPIPDATADGVYASHVLEHLSRDDCMVALRNTFRLLRPGGRFRLVIPDLAIRARRYLNRLDTGDAEANSWFMRSSGLGMEGKPGSRPRRAGCSENRRICGCGTSGR